MSTLVGRIGPYEVRIPNSGGKAGKGRNVTGTVQVLENNMLLKSWRFSTESLTSKEAALQKARKFVNDNL